MPTNYERTVALAGEGWSQVKIAAELGVSRQQVSQYLARDTPPGPRGPRHGSTVKAALCGCETCFATKARYFGAMPGLVARLRAGESLAMIRDATGFDIRTLDVERERATIAAGKASLLADFVAAYDETAGLRRRGRPKRAA